MATGDVCGSSGRGYGETGMEEWQFLCADEAVGVGDSPNLGSPLILYGHLG